MNSVQALRQSRMIAGYRAPHFVLEVVQRRSGGVGVDRLVDRLQVPAQLVPVLPGREPERVADQMDQAGLHDRGRPDRVHTVGQAFQTVADQEEHISDAAVAELGQHRHPELGRLPAAVAEPHAEDVLVALQIDPDRGIDGPVARLGRRGPSP